VTARPRSAGRRRLSAALVLLSLVAMSDRLAFALSVTDETKLVPTGAQGGYEAGWAVAMSGEHLVVGVPQDAATVPSGGAAIVYRIVGGVLTEQAKLTASSPVEGDELGVSVDIDGDTIIAGAYHRFVGVDDHGKAVVFTGSGSTWSEQAELVAYDASVNDAFGWAVAISGDYAAVGAPKAWSGSTGNGAVYVYHREDGVWIHDVKLSPPNEHSLVHDVTKSTARSASQRSRRRTDAAKASPKEGSPQAIASGAAASIDATTRPTTSARMECAR